jgi:hypothetical protein
MTSATAGTATATGILAGAATAQTAAAATVTARAAMSGSVALMFSANGLLLTYDPNLIPSPLRTVSLRGSRVAGVGAGRSSTLSVNRSETLH